jgi:hypothetical protein
MCLEQQTDHLDHCDAPDRMAESSLSINSNPQAWPA